MNSSNTTLPASGKSSQHQFAQSPERQWHVDVPLYDNNWPFALRWRGSVLRQIWWKVLGFALWSALWTVLYQVVPVKLNIPTLIIQVIGMVLSLLLVFRTNTAYDRFWEGRRLWGSTVCAIRNLTRFVWVGVREDTARDAIEKRSAVNLLIAFAVSTKHYLRAEYGSDYPDLRGYLNHIPKYNTPTSVEPNNTATSSLLRQYKDGTKIRPSNLPLEISIYLTSYIHHQKVKGTIDPGQFTVMTNTLSSLVECLTGFERILRTPIPLAYTRQGSRMGYHPRGDHHGFTMFGIQSIGEEIENPFGYDANDLPLDEFCKVVKSEVDIITSVPSPNPDDWIFSDANPEQHRKQHDADDTDSTGTSIIDSSSASKQKHEHGHDIAIPID
ncbi:Bestrophin, RFP-TM, chloride channel-domain-containing protein [Syncephalis plumigaleata]|nr:Bestrophin, RFP-TM, chloride channel-domain-containing protein [Syncephalis plumigaleata]